MINNKKGVIFITTIYLIRHSVRMPVDNIESYHTSQSDLVLSEKIVLNTIGEKRAEILCSQKELQNIDVVYASNCVRTLQTAKYMLEAQNLKVNIDDRLDERRVGKRNDDSVTDWFSRQYYDRNYKTEGGESQLDVQNRVSEVFDEIVRKYDGKRIAVFTHGYAITFFLLKYCKLLNVDGKNLKIEYKDKIIFDKAINAPEVFKFTVENNEVTNIELIEFDELPYMRGV